MSKYLALCAYCGAYWSVDNENETQIGHKCNWCQSDGTLINTKHPSNYFAAKYMTTDQYQLSEHLMNDYIRNNPLYSKEYEEKRTNQEAELLKMSGTNWRKLELVDNSPIIEPYTREDLDNNFTNTMSKNIPSCPTCGSTDIEKISGTNKVGKAFLFGLFSVGTLTKTYHCKNCGYKW